MKIFIVIQQACCCSSNISILKDGLPLSAYCVKSETNNSAALLMIMHQI